MAGVELRGLVKKYGDFTAVAGIDLDIAEGELVVLLGPSGCGKTTTLRCIAGLESISGGEIRMGGELVSSAGFSVPPEKRENGMVFQSYAIWPHMSVADNVAFGLKLKKLSKALIAKRVADALNLVGLGSLGDRGASQLSGGQQQRVALARAIVLEPKVLLFDEPLSNLDAKLRERMRFEIRQIQRRLGITSVYVTHDQQEAMVVADRVVLLNEGHIDQVDTPMELYQRPVSHFGAEFVGLANIMPGSVSRHANGTATILLSGGETLETTDTRFPLGTEVEAICRPENLQVSPHPIIGPNSFEARVTYSWFLGNIADLVVQAGNLSLRCQLSPPYPWAEGSVVHVQLPPEAVILIAKM